MTTTSSPANDRAAYNLRADGMGYARIAEVIGFVSAAAAYSAVKRYCRLNSIPVPGQSAARVAGSRSGALRRYRGIVAEEQAANPNHVANATRRFGVEIEVKGISCGQASRVVNGLGIDCANDGYDHRTRSTWKVVDDGSLSGESCEVVSPPLSGPEGIDQIKQVMAALREAGARIDRQCGLHVHHEVTDLTGAEIATLIEMYANHSGDLNALVAPSRRNANYCRLLGRDEVTRYADAFRSGISTPADAARYGIGGRPDSRYRVLNVHSYGSYGTLEFRQHQGTLSGSKTSAWILLGQAMIEAARARTALTQGALLAGLADAGHLDSATASFLTRRSATLA